MNAFARKTMPVTMLLTALLVLQGIMPVFAANNLDTAYAAGNYDDLFSYVTDGDKGVGTALDNGIAADNTVNYPQTPDGSFSESGGEVNLDDEGFVTYADDQNRDIAYLKKSVTEVENNGLFEVALDVKGNTIRHPIDVVFVIDYSSTMKGEKLTNAVEGVQTFLTSVQDAMAADQVLVGAVGYNRPYNIPNNNLAYTTGSLTNDPNEILDFLTNTAKSGTGTFTQSGLYAGQEIFENFGRPGAERLLIHIGDGDANCAYYPASGAVEHSNNGEIVSLNGYSAATYITDFDLTKPQYLSSMSSTSDPNAVLGQSKTLIANYTIGTAVDIRNQGTQIFSIATGPSGRGEYVARNLASSASHYVTIDENLQGLSDALANFAAQIDSTISHGTVIDPMGDYVLLQKEGNSFGPNDYTLEGLRWNGSAWVSAPDLVEGVGVVENNGTISLTNLGLGEDERVVLKYKVRLDTESASFNPDAWYLANKETTLDPTSSGNELPFPIPSIKAPSMELTLKKLWEDGYATETVRPDAIEVVLERSPVVSDSGWTTTQPIEVTAADNWETTVDEVTPVGMDDPVRLPAYNNNGDPFVWDAIEITDGDKLNNYESSALWDAGSLTLSITNTLKRRDFSFQKQTVMGEALAGATFTLTSTEGAGYSQTVTSGADGSVTFTNLPPGRYTLQETVAPDDYQLLPQSVQVVVAADANGELQLAFEYKGQEIEWGGVVYNLPDQANVPEAFPFIKRGETGTDSSEPLENIEFKLTSITTDAVFGPLASDSNGLVNFAGIPTDVYLLEEVATEAPYVKMTPVIVFVYWGPVTSFAAEPLSVPEVATTEEPPVEEVPAIEEAITEDMSGEEAEETALVQALAESSPAIPQNTIEEITPALDSEPQAEVLDATPRLHVRFLAPNTTVTFNEDGIPVIMNRQETSFTFTKTDDQDKPLAGATFVLQDAEGAIVYGPEISDGSGMVSFEGLRAGTYSLVEIDAPEGYQPIDPIEVTVTFNEDGELEVNLPSNYTAVNKQLTTISFLKTDTEGNPLAGAEFTLTPTDGGDPLVATSGADGKVVFTGVTAGDYNLAETKVPAGYELDSTVVPVTVGYDDGDGELKVLTPDNWYTDFSVTNAPKTTTITFTKRDDLGAIMSGTEFPDLSFDLMTAEGAPVATASPNAQGVVSFTDVPAGSYYLVENTPEYFENFPAFPVEVTVGEDGNLVVSAEWDPLDPVVTNYHKTTGFSFTKLGWDGDPLAGAEFQLLDAEGTVVATVTSDIDGLVSFEDLREGEYTLTESKVPTGYKPIAGSIGVTVAMQEGDLVASFNTAGHDNLIDGKVYNDLAGLTDLSFKKVGQQVAGTKPLAGVSFRLSELYTGEPAYESTSNTEGVLVFKDVQTGIYVLEETSTPAGYLPIEPLLVHVIANPAGDIHVEYPDTTFEFDDDGRPIIVNKAIGGQGGGDGNITAKTGDVVGDFILLAMLLLGASAAALLLGRARRDR